MVIMGVHTHTHACMHVYRQTYTLFPEQIENWFSENFEFSSLSDIKLKMRICAYSKKEFFPLAILITQSKSLFIF